MKLSYIQARREGHNHILELGFLSPRAGKVGLEHSFHAEAFDTEVSHALQELARRVMLPHEAPDFPPRAEVLVPLFDDGLRGLLLRVPRGHELQVVCRINPAWFDVLRRHVMLDPDTRFAPSGPPRFRGAVLIPDDRVRNLEFALREGRA